MKIVKHIFQPWSRGLDLFVVTVSASQHILEWSGPTREQSGRSFHKSVQSAIAGATRRFGIPPGKWRDGDPFEHPRWSVEDHCPSAEEGSPTLADVWEYFAWSTPQIPQLTGILRTRLQQRIRKYEDEKELYPNDPDERSINRAWCGELSSTLRRWCALLELNPDDLTGYRKALRQSVWNEDLIRTDAIASIVCNLLSARANGSDLTFRPSCLQVAHQELMKWLERHPQDVDRVHHRTFEAIVSEIIKGSGWTVELTKQTRDGGFDLMCLQNDCVGTPVKMLVETKLYNLKYSIGLPMIDRLMGVRDREHANRAVLVTNSRFSKTVWKLWEERVGRDLALIDRDELLEWLLAGRGEPKWSSMPISSDSEMTANPGPAPDSQRASHVGCR